MTNFSLALQNPDLLTTSDVDTPAERFEYFRRALKKYGEALGTGHKRIAIPKSLLSEEELTDTLGFVPTDIAIPEAGQTDWTSYRNPYSTYHLHEHGAFWTMHQDEHVASTMMFYRYTQEQKKKGKEPSLAKRIELFFRGLPHVIAEGVPGAYYYIKGQITGTEDMLERLRVTASNKYWDFLNTMQQRMEREQGVLSSFLGVSLKRRLASIVWSSLFSAKDDVYNTIEGMRHGGMAGDMRPYDTDFGSGLTTRMFGSMKAFIQASRANLKTKLSQAISQLTIHENAPLSMVKGHGGARAVISDVAREIFYNKEEVLKSIGEQVPKLQKRYSKEAIANVADIMKYHEMSEIYYGGRQLRQIMAGRKQKATMIGFHFSPGVIVDEMLMSMKLGDETFQLMKEFRTRQSKQFTNRLVALFGGKKVKAERAYAARVNKIVETMEKNYLPRFSADHGAYNTIEGMSHKGMAGQMRPVNTDMGSRSDPLRAIARGMGLMGEEGFQQLLGSSAWQHALSKAKLVKVLERGSFGEAQLYRVAFGGREIKAVRKVIHEKAESNLEFLAQRYATNTGKTIEESREVYAKSMNLEREATFYRALGETPSVPSAYGASQKELWMEFMPGEEMAKIAEKRPQFVMPEKAQQELRETFDIAAQKGILNPDIHGGNILYSEATGRASLLDLGQARTVDVPAEKLAQKMQYKLKRVSGVIHPRTPPNPFLKPTTELTKSVSSSITTKRNKADAVWRASQIKKRQLSIDLDKAKQAIWEAQHLGGNRHVIKPVGQPVEQISVFADTIEP